MLPLQGFTLHINLETHTWDKVWWYYEPLGEIIWNLGNKLEMHREHRGTQWEYQSPKKSDPKRKRS
jgi:hypothetical protein